MSSDQRQVGFSGLWLPEGEDPRLEKEQPVGELATYRDYLRHYRLTLELKCQDLGPEELARQSVPPSDLSLIGLVRHMARVEHGWFERVLKKNLDIPRLDADDPTGGFHKVEPTQESVDEAFSRWREQVTAADAWLDSIDNSTLGEMRDTGDEQASVRDILVHMIEEYARHAGHADLLREVIDGRTGQ
ncbi:putative damage-inducible protein DinB [Nocardioides luteus]|uniref:DinB family protein n=1 Tax=Nocardioides luteus TaxID=1844 RepID=UPI001666DDE3|nr:DinB family protein [Nocardioides luteus]MDR7309512.1 putative damage-inducible protein DinB [Nocardioides luteus]